MSDSEPRTRRRWVSLGEIIALAALIVSALGLWITWQSSQKDGPTRIVEQKPAIPLVLRGSTGDDGKLLAVAPVEATHALDSLSVALPGGSTIETGSDGRIFARKFQGALNGSNDEKDSGTVGVKITARYVEMGQERRASGNYLIRYHWQGGGLFGGRSLRFDGMSRA
jgi:hypothetical protein